MTTHPTVLKPCPFCGSEATLSGGAGEKLYDTVGCNNEDCYCPRFFIERDESNKEEMIEAWNRRAL